MEYTHQHIDIYDVVTNTWSKDYLPVNRYMATAVRVLNTAIFAGGLNTVAAPYIPVNLIDLYADPNLRTEEVSQTELQFFNEYRIDPNPEASNTVVFDLMVVVLLVKPTGLTGRAA